MNTDNNSLLAEQWWNSLTVEQRDEYADKYYPIKYNDFFLNTEQVLSVWDKELDEYEAYCRNCETEVDTLGLRCKHCGGETTKIHGDLSQPMQDELLTLRKERAELLELLEECELHLQTKYPKEAAINDKVSRFIERLKH